LANYLRFGDRSVTDTGLTGGGKFGNKTYAHSGGYHRQYPILALASVRAFDLDAEILAEFVNVVSVLAVDTVKIGFALNVSQVKRLALLKPMPHRESETKTLAVDRFGSQTLVKWLRLCRQRDIKFSLKKEFYKPTCDTLDDGHCYPRMRSVERVEETHEADRANRTHDAQLERR